MFQGDQNHRNYTALDKYDTTQFFDYLLNYTNYNSRMRPNPNSLVEVGSWYYN